MTREEAPKNATGLSSKLFDEGLRGASGLSRRAPVQVAGGSLSCTERSALQAAAASRPRRRARLPVAPLKSESLAAASAALRASTDSIGPAPGRASRAAARSSCARRSELPPAHDSRASRASDWTQAQSVGPEGGTGAAGVQRASSATGPGRDGGIQRRRGAGQLPRRARRPGARTPRRRDSPERPRPPGPPGTRRAGGRPPRRPRPGRSSLARPCRRSAASGSSSRASPTPLFYAPPGLRRFCPPASSYPESRAP